MGSGGKREKRKRKSEKESEGEKREGRKKERKREKEGGRISVILCFISKRDFYSLQLI